MRDQWVYNATTTKEELNMIPSIEMLRDAIIQWAKTTTSTHHLHAVYVYIKKTASEEKSDADQGPQERNTIVRR